MNTWSRLALVLGHGLAIYSAPAAPALGTEDCTWSAIASGPSKVVGEFSGSAGTVVIDNSAWPPLSVDAVVQDDDPQPEPPWLIIRLRNSDRSAVRDPAVVSEINFAIPGMTAFETGPFNRVWGNFRAGPNSYKANADYLRRDVIGLPEGTGIGFLLTSNVYLTRNDDSKLIGSFEARFIDPELFRQLDLLEQHPVGVGVHPITAASIVLTGEFSLLKDGSCGGGYGRPGRLKAGN